MPGIVETYRRNRMAFIGTGAVVAGVGIAFLQLRKPAAPAIIVSGTSDPATPSTDPLAAFQAGAAAAGSGLAVGAGLGQSSLDLAGTVVASQGYVAQALTGSQASVAATSSDALAAALATAIGAITTPTAVPAPAPTPAPAPAPNPTPTPMPTTQWWPAYKGTPPSNATFAIRFAANQTYNQYDSAGKYVHQWRAGATGTTVWGNQLHRTAAGALIGRLIDGSHPGIYVAIASGAAFWLKPGTPT